MYRALVVDDDPQVAQINAGYLQQAGFSVARISYNAAEAMDYLRRDPNIHLILLDIYLPGDSGLSLLRDLRSEQHQIEVIIVSAAKNTVQIREAFRLGCLDYMIKPFTYERLQTALDKFRSKAELLRKDFLSQSEVDRLAAWQAEPAPDLLPKGIDRKTLGLICSHMKELESPFGIPSILDRVPISRVSAKKYLDFLCEQKVLQQTYVYGNKGRPASLYQLSDNGDILYNFLSQYADE